MCIRDRYRVKLDKKEKFVYTDTELEALQVDEDNFTEIFEAENLNELGAQLEKFSLDIRDYFAGKDNKTTNQVYIVTNEEEKQMFSLQEVLDFIKEQAQKGLVIQRYKGLGEMNPEQLWTTTMNPETRTLMQVTLEDDVDADKIFTVLMGDEVEPRRQFISTHAHEVKNLDI